jgi:DNA-directed RNA polymerase subunit L
MATQPKIRDISNDDNILKFTLSNVNVSIANAVRRTVLSDIPTVVFKTTPQEENRAKIITNTSRLNNEILKQRLSCIPIHIEKLNIKSIENYLLEVNVENNTNDSIIYVTTEDFRIRDISEDRLISKEDSKVIFPPWIAPDGTEHYIEFLSLRPKISDSIPGEGINLTCELSYSTSKENAMYNCVSVCSYGFSINTKRQEEILGELRKEWKKDNLNVEFEEANWLLLEGQRDRNGTVLKDSFDFIVQTVGVYENTDIIKKSCDIIIEKLNRVNTLLKTNDELIIPSENTMENCYDITLLNEDYTIGKVIEYMLYSLLFDVSENKLLSYCGFKKLHPHDTFSIIRVAYIEETSRDIIKQNVDICIMKSIEIFRKIYSLFDT